MSAGTALLTITYAATGSLLSELFPAEYRYSAVRLGYNLAARSPASPRSSPPR